MWGAVLWSVVAAAVVAAVLAAGHALLNKRDPRAALGWIVTAVVFPVLGPTLYFVFGINRVFTRAKALHRNSASPTAEDASHGPAASRDFLPTEFATLARISDAVSRWPLVAGNHVDVLHNGEQAYPPMLQAIDEAQQSVYLITYIFETNETGRKFVDALTRAKDRGVDVRVIVDGVGENYSWPRVSRLLQARNVRVARFIPPRLIPPSLHVNLRTHRKLLVVDGRTAFTGGMNIGDRHLAARVVNPDRVVDVHFRCSGPVVRQLQHVFFEDWAFVTGEQELPPNSTPVPEDGTALCRTIVDGPNEDLDRLTRIIEGALSAARRSIRIMTPYFIPPRGLIGALQAAALRGVDVRIVLPGKSNLPYVDWASRNMLWELLEHGVRIYYQPPPFVHSKLLIVDDHYVEIGSANIDPRSLRLNFELIVEIYDRGFASTVVAHFDEVRGRSREVSLGQMDSRPLPIRLRDAAAWLFSPYL
ncbi:MAG: cardiolipin synthase [bacterium]|nr:cardiolipin synthase [bacterium]